LTGCCASGRVRRRPRFAAVPAILLAAAGCAARPPAFGPAGAEESRLALDAWSDAVARADSLGPAMLLYNARLSEGLVKLPGTLAVKQSPGFLEATLTGPFGTPIARYGQGLLEARGAKPVPLEAEELRSVLAGVWRGTPSVAGARAGETLLRFEGTDQVEGVLELPGARLASLTIGRPEAELVATYSGRLDPWPEKIDIEDRRTGKRLELTLVAREPMEARQPE